MSNEQEYVQEIDLGYDLGDAKRSEDSEIVPKGQYLVEVARGNILPPHDDKSATAMITLKVIDAEKLENANYIGAQFMIFIPLMLSVNWKQAQFMDAALGVKITGKKFNLAPTIGKRLVARVIVDDYQGKDSNKVERFMAAAKFRKGTGETPAAPDGNSEVSI